MAAGTTRKHFYEDFWRLYSTTTTGQRMSKEDWILDAAHCQKASDALLIAIPFSRKLIEVIEVKKVLKGLRSPLFGVHG
ncbi:hypothetical protein B9Z55_014651 [Caenorhabditis nigoni]|uniref:Uncharacterized protein n=1 Tax=Caenorhabditis nigoni TaxID=1611254 RepID=A0A2G5U6R1_9PELO|nr:hypothetical protein B9Z55_014651 [Caenorhabditis nigoni]